MCLPSLIHYSYLNWEAYFSKTLLSFNIFFYNRNFPGFVCLTSLLSKYQATPEIAFLPFCFSPPHHSATLALRFPESTAVPAGNRGCVSISHAPVTWLWPSVISNLGSYLLCLNHCGGDSFVKDSARQPRIQQTSRLGCRWSFCWFMKFGGGEMSIIINFFFFAPSWGKEPSTW